MIVWFLETIITNKGVKGIRVKEICMNVHKIYLIKLMYLDTYHASMLYAICYTPLGFTSYKIEQSTFWPNWWIDSRSRSYCLNLNQGSDTTKICHALTRRSHTRHTITKPNGGQILPQPWIIIRLTYYLYKITITIGRNITINVYQKLSTHDHHKHKKIGENIGNHHKRYKIIIQTKP